MKYPRFFAVLIITLLTAINLSATVAEDLFGNKKVIISDMKPFLTAVEEAQDSLYLAAYKLHDTVLPNEELSTALMKAAQKENLKGKIYILLEGNLTAEEKKEGNPSVMAGESRKAYEKLGIQICYGSPLYKATHCKFLTTAGYALVGTTNYDKEFEDGDLIIRDFSLIIRDPKIINELKEVFRADIDKRQIKFPSYQITDLKVGDTVLTWGPEQHQEHLKGLFQQATQTIEIYQQAFQDDEIADLVVAAIQRGVKVSILMSEFPFGPKHGNKSEQNQRKIINTRSEKGSGEVRLTGDLIKGGEMEGKRLHIHAKVVIVDGTKMYLGSTNFYSPALKGDRNAGILTGDPEYIKPVYEQFMKDWQATNKTLLN